MSDLAFFDIVDRFSALSQTLLSKASHPSQTQTNYTRAVLTDPLIKSVRDVDDIEAALFVVQAPSPGVEPSGPALDLKRRESVNATPLRKAREAPLQLWDAEECLESVLKLGEKYQIMPRAQGHAKELMKYVGTLSQSISILEHELMLAKKPLKPVNPISSAKQEEKLTREMEARVAAARRKRDELLGKIRKPSARETGHTTESDASIFTSPSTIRTLLNSSQTGDPPPAPPPQRKLTTAEAIAQRRAARQATRDAKRPQKSSQPPSEDEVAFWSATPRPVSSQSKGPKGESGGEETEETSSAGGSPVMSVPNPSLRWSLAGRKVAQPEETETELESKDEEETEGDGDATVILGAEPKTTQQEVALPQRRAFSLLRNPRNPHSRLTVEVQARIPSEVASKVQSKLPTQQQVESSEPSSQKDQVETFIKVLPEPGIPSQPSTGVSPEGTSDSLPLPVTPEVESQISRVWKTAGDILIPDHKYGVGQQRVGPPPPGSRETIKLLVALEETPISSSKSTDLALRSVLSEHTATPSPSVTTVQVFTAKIILLLLAALPNKVDQVRLKEALKAHPWAAVGIEGTADASTKVLYTCMGKKLIVIERREGTVRFAS
ncbi:uncharacterized protein EI90DRAFT_3149860 [Cantharellus anzutake]|uniref:uncharacterized protein n=1 Tax=Cantharellus anzutake TaxID=1750568 RepID=UPI001908BDB6|nr:uncharacterized protein EI90DRAFT_3149860 [Cantharellus anzutake]KAF8342783.1 hypothetical protein EI90DRAFT_3149860 [Cantharellus anzutake]